MHKIKSSELDLSSKTIKNPPESYPFCFEICFLAGLMHPALAVDTGLGVFSNGRTLPVDITRGLVFFSFFNHGHEKLGCGRRSS